MENITTEEVMDKLDMFQTRFGKLDEFGWWDMERIQNDADTQFTSKEFQGGLYVCEIHLVLEALNHQEMIFKVEVICQTYRTITHSIMVQSRVSDKYIHF